MNEIELKKALEDMVIQFASRSVNHGIPVYSTGGLFVLENAFRVLGWENPHPCPENKCETEGCDCWATCGTSTANGYKRVCRMHCLEINKELI